ncbi:hypothetical protein PR048_015095 [Dryococelus australis]|uniref:Uncharacterized protein n=1 Tax=Dryococelus australis TaxID=614101 RepID=A0ABQ9HGZ1_9NEOP|nr:hypothetical protein PR048_015095 [Dryococelus australis]
MPLVGGFSRGSPVYPTLSFRSCSILASVPLIGSEDLDVKGRPNVFTHSLTFHHPVKCCSFTKESNHYQERFQAHRGHSISPGFVDTPLLTMPERNLQAGFVESNPMLLPIDIAEAMLYVLGTPPRVQLTATLQSTFIDAIQYVLHYMGLLLAHRSNFSPLTKAIRIRFPARSPFVGFHRWGPGWTMPVIEGFSRGSPVSSALKFRRRSAFNSPHLTLIGFQAPRRPESP